MEHLALKITPACTINLLILTSPSIIAVDFKFRASFTSIFPLILPSMSAFKHFMLPSMTPSFPTTTFPDVVLIHLNNHLF